MRSFAAITFLALAMIVGCGNERLILRPEHKLRDDQGRALLGQLKHRGQYYRLRDLMDAKHRARSDAEFVRDFDPDSQLATFWAGR